MMTRRKMLGVLAGTTAALTCNQLSATGSPCARRLGIGMHSYGFHWRAAKEKNSGAKFSDALEFLVYAHQLGAGGVQVAIGSKDAEFARRIKTKAEEHQMYFEAQFSLPAN